MLKLSQVSLYLHKTTYANISKIHGIRCLTSLHGKNKEYSKYMNTIKYPVSKFSSLPSNNNDAVIQQERLTLMEFAFKYVGGYLLSPLAVIGIGFITIKNNHTGVLTRFGKFEGLKKEGLYWVLLPGFNYTSVFMGNRTFKLPESKVVDKNGNPIIISAIVNYKICEPEKFFIRIKCDSDYIHNQAEAIIKKIASKYPYESSDDHNLKSESDKVINEMRTFLQNKVSDIGVNIESVELTDLNYAPEIAQQMLIKQQAEAYIEAKSAISKASLDIVKEINEQVDDSLSEEDRSSLIKNLLIVISSGSSVQPTLPMN